MTEDNNKRCVAGRSGVTICGDTSASVLFLSSPFSLPFLLLEEIFPKMPFSGEVSGLSGDWGNVCERI